MPLESAPPRAHGNATTLTEGLSGQTLFPYEAADWATAEMGNWLPWIHSPDYEINQFRDRMVGRTRDLVRNDGWAAGGIIRILDSTVGAALRLHASPDWRALSARFGIKAFDATWAEEFRKTAEALWRDFSDDVEHFNDVEGKQTVSQQMRLGKRHKLVDGDSLVVCHWLPELVGRGAANYATAFQVVDPDRLSNPYQMVDSKYLRGGVELDARGRPIAYHIRKAHQNDWYNVIESMEWERVERTDPDGWRRVIHDFEMDRAGQNRGVGVFTPVISRFKMLARYYGVELQAATIAAVFGTYVTSPYDPTQVEDALEASDSLSAYQQIRADWAKERPAMLNGARIPTLAPGEDIKAVSAAHPHGGFADFAREMLKTFAACTGLSAEQITQDWSKTNYSSGRAAMLESWKTLNRRFVEFKIGTANPMYSCWLHEAMDNGELPLPNGAPDFLEARTAYSRCDWLGVPRGWVDPVKEKQGAILGMDAALSTLKRECAEQGTDYEETIHQRAAEKKLFEEAGLPPPKWYGDDANSAAQSPEEPEPA